MDLALQIGMTADGLKRAMTEREFRQWVRYAGRRMLPQRRIEMYLAQIAQVIVRTMGGRPAAELAEFLFDPQPDPGDDMDTEATSAEDVAAFFGASVHRKKGRG
jgi:hypothetical protein